MRRHDLMAVVVGALMLTTFTMGAAPASSAPATTFTAYNHTGVVTPKGIAANGKYLWVTDIGSAGIGAHLARIDAATGDAQSVTGKFGVLLSQVVASRRYAWVMVAKRRDDRWSLLRVNASTLAVKDIKIPSAYVGGIGYQQGPILLAGSDVWIPGVRGILRVNTTTLKSSTITSPLIGGSLITVAADGHYLWLNPPINGSHQAFFVRVSLVTGVVSAVSFPGVPGGFPVGDDGTDLWVMDHHGLQRINPTTDQVLTIAVPKEAQIFFPTVGPSAVANGAIYFCANLVTLQHNGVVRVETSSGRATVLSSPLLYQPSMVAAANGVVWVVNIPAGNPGSPRRPVLVRVT